ncbi:sulfite exporter TauE/SafE family protein [Candidatus Uhrbacteria bacterium]|nr:sulfite exporter TauE/SafE family protein [Candidatus Uhrbacteria bacterium]
MTLFLLALLALLASMIGTVTGFGVSMVMVPVLLLFFPLPTTLLLVGVIHWFEDVWKLVLFREGVRWKLLLLFSVPGSVFTLLGARIVLASSGEQMLPWLAWFLIAYVFFLFLHPSFKIRPRPAVAAVGGALSGFAAGLLGIGGAIRGAFLSAFDLPKAVYLATGGAVGLIVDSVRLGAYVQGGFVLPSTLLFGLGLFIPASFLGAFLGRRLVARIPQKQFRTVVAVFLLAVAVRLLLV